MSPVFVASYVVLWILVIGFVVLTMLLYRQYGLTLLSGSQRINLRGLDIGSAPEVLALTDVSGKPVGLNWEDLDLHGYPAARVALFAEPTCPICSGILERGDDLAQLAAKWSNVEFVWIDGEVLDPGLRPDGWTIAVAEEGPTSARRAMQIPAYPFTYVVAGNRIASKGLVNSPEDIEGLVQDALGSHPEDRSRLPEAPVSVGGGRA